MSLYTRVFENKENILVNSSAGCGKSYILQKIHQKALSLGIKSYLTSTTGLSAYNIGGTTLHSFAAIGKGDKSIDNILSLIRFNKAAKQRIRECELLIIDEVSMLGLNTLELIDEVLRNVRNTNEVMGGIQLILSGDFLQLPPINDKFIFQSFIWDLFDLHIIRLSTPHRYPDLQYYAILQRVRKAQHTPDDIRILNSRIDAYKLYLKYEENREKFLYKRINKVIKNKNFSKIVVSYALNQYDIKPTRLYARKVNVERYNNDELDKLEGKCMIYNANDRIRPKGKTISKKKIEYYTNYMNDIIGSEVKLKVGAQVMLTVNKDVSRGLTNGSRGVVIELFKDGVLVQFRNGENTIIERHDFKFEDDSAIVTRSQVPLILGYSLTVHKIQGSTLDFAVLDLGDSIFSPALSYVALSRVKTLSGVYLIDFNPKKIYCHPDALEFEEELDKT